MAGGVAFIIAAATHSGPGQLGMFPAHMLWHIVLMNALAPALGWALATQAPAFLDKAGLDKAGLDTTGRWRVALRRAGSVTFLCMFGALQLALLLVWHSPEGLALAMNTPAGGIAMQASLFAAATAFWVSVFAQSGVSLWRALIALLVTGKIYCLLAAILVFAPRVLYPQALFSHGAISLADQQLAGVMMVVACPLSYVVVALFLTARWFTALGETPRASTMKDA